MIEHIKITMLGGLTVTVDGVSMLDSSSKINKPWQVFCFLVLNRKVPSAPTRLISNLWPEENLTDPGNVLKNTVYALRREFKNVDNASESPVLFENGGYLCNPDIRFEVDAEQFEENCRNAAMAKGEEKLSLLHEAVDLYKGELLPQLENEVWVMPLALYYRKQFAECVGELCNILQESGRYSELLTTATAASQIDPLEEQYYLYTFRALYALGMHRVIIPTYHKTARIFSEELGASLSSEIREIFEASSERVDSIEQDIMIIKDDLREVAKDNRPIRGPLYCTYDVFKYLYQMVARSSERSGSKVIIVLLSLQSENGEQPTSKTFSTAMSQIKSAVLGGLLRRSDTVARYSKSQYIIMLSIEKPSGAQTVMDRIAVRCEPYLQPLGLKIVFAKTELEPV
ncbi:bacterial transcriptional activator domain-containing protein [Ruminococcaceae bacterium OttesenSCG-928-I18]|nr:bacterial transcriptional activator domain-containing protein [Ruminococcaceae bacterium OttesenSCG-928-I18]